MNMPLNTKKKVLHRKYKHQQYSSRAKSHGCGTVRHRECSGSGGRCSPGWISFSGQNSVCYGAPLSRTPGTTQTITCSWGAYTDLTREITNATSGGVLISLYTPLRRQQCRMSCRQSSYSPFPIHLR